MKGEILSVGTELLLGDILNTNAQTLARKLAALGVDVYYQTVVGDNAERLHDFYGTAFERSDLVVVTGGLGPTEDDLTKETGAKFFNKEMILHEDIARELEEYFKNSGIPYTQNNLKQAYFPEGSVILPNDNGTAPGCLIEENGKILVMMPGPPNEMIPMLENHVAPYLKKKNGSVLVSRTLRLCGIGESYLETQIKDLMEGSNPTLAPYAKTGEVHLRLTAKAENREDAEALLTPVVEDLYGRFSSKIYGEGEDTLEKVVTQLLISKKLTLAVAESLTGGELTSRLVDVPGISKALLEGIVAYSNQAKLDRLGVSQETLEAYGAVSAQTATEMARGAAAGAGADIGISTTGIAGPGGGTDKKPVGLTYIGVYMNGKTMAREFHFKGNRLKIRERAVVTALNLLRNIIKREGIVS